MWAVPFSSTQRGLQRCTISWAQLLSLNYKLHFVMTNCVTSEGLDSASAWAIKKMHSMFLCLSSISCHQCHLWEAASRTFPFFDYKDWICCHSSWEETSQGFPIKKWAVCYSQALNPTNVNFFGGENTNYEYLSRKAHAVTRLPVKCSESLKGILRVLLHVASSSSICDGNLCITNGAWE